MGHSKEQYDPPNWATKPGWPLPLDLAGCLTANNYFITLTEELWLTEEYGAPRKQLRGREEWKHLQGMH